MPIKNTATADQRTLSHPKYRADIDGLRAIAVLAVLGFHAFPSWVKGGFVGVDVFFVISGFLITSIILDNLDKGTFSFPAFFARRIKRIFPALILVMLATYVFGWFALLAVEYKQLGKHIAAGAGFISNFIFWQEAGYFDTAADTKPLLHVWSLGIEEQFYIVWPLLLFFAWEKHLRFLWLCTVIAAVSFALNIERSSWDAVAAFYSPAMRFWELLLGGFLAYIKIHDMSFMIFLNQKVSAFLGKPLCASSASADGKVLREIQSIVGIVLIGSAIVLIDKEKVFPGWWALLPTIGAFLVLCAGQQAWFNRTVLSSRVLVWVGLISFPLYLWHWPLLSFARITENATPSSEIRIAALLISLILAWLTYVLIEKPIRFGKYSNKKIVILCLLMLVIGLLGYYTDKKNGLGFRLKEFELAVKDINLVIENTPVCKAVIPVDSRYCLISDPSRPPSVALIGDSHSNRLFAPLERRYKEIGENLLQLGGGGCLPFWNLETGSPGNSNNCAAQMAPQLDFLLASKTIKTIIFMHRGPVHIEGIDLSTNTKLFIKDLSRPEIVDTRKIYEGGLVETLRRFSNAGKKIILIIDAPEFDYNPLSCVDLVRPLSFTSKKRLSCRIGKSDVDRRNYNYIKITTAASILFDNVRVVNLQDALCDENYCYGVKDGKLLYRDADHLNPFGAEYVTRQLWSKFR
ncbi:MAG: acyltransferase [Burkholderiaceae bacterium]|nr:MAG: acyltransferase [Burkholderiaceae bacterium]